MATLASLPAGNAVLDLNNAQCQSNRDAWKPVLEKFETSLRQVSFEGNAKSLARQQERGQLLGG
jgi:hypothetical protein